MSRSCEELEIFRRALVADRVKQPLNTNHGDIISFSSRSRTLAADDRLAKNQTRCLSYAIAKQGFPHLTSDNFTGSVKSMAIVNLSPASENSSSHVQSLSSALEEADWVFSATSPPLLSISTRTSIVFKVSTEPSATASEPGSSKMIENPRSKLLLVSLKLKRLLRGLPITKSKVVPPICIVYE